MLLSLFQTITRLRNHPVQIDWRWNCWIITFEDRYIAYGDRLHYIPVISNADPCKGLTASVIKLVGQVTQRADGADGDVVSPEVLSSSPL